MKPFASLLLTICLMTTGFFAGAQKALDPNNPIVYLGIDFSALKIINEPRITAMDVKTQYQAINQLVVAEAKKYDWATALGMPNYSSDIGVTMARNEQADISHVFTTNTADDAHLKEDDIKKMVAKYNFQGKKGTGLIVFYETFNKGSETGSMWVTFIDMGTKKVLLTERMSGSAKGFSVRNYWTAPVYKVIQDVKKYKASEWRSKI
ncbi:MAG TPA: hypothetical protein PLQ65_12120 [Flavihumibacter sp.]|nr:hypothetical protein [Bacteroidota bacterium]HQD10406.1 hypothetical protein [Flavihumibacter sp.]